MAELSCCIPGCKFQGGYDCKKNKSNTSDCEYKDKNFCGYHYKHKIHFKILEELKNQSKGANSAGGRRKRTRKHKNHRRRTHRK